jgi:hypothetical protein
VITGVRAVSFDVPMRAVVDGQELTAEEIDRIALADGFEDADALLDWFCDTHGLPFEGHIYNWAPVASAAATA